MFAALLLFAAAFQACGPTRADMRSVRPSPAVAAPPALAETAAPSAHASTYLVLRLKARRLDLMKDDARVASFPIAIGRRGHETPTGTFHVEEKVVRPDFPKVDPDEPTRLLALIPPGPDNPLGERWIGFAHGAGWTVGIHGTPHPELLGQAVSGGCIRMRNADVMRVYDQVELGTPVVVYP